MFAYTAQNPVMGIDPLGLVCGIDVWTENYQVALDYGYENGYKSTWVISGSHIREDRRDFGPTGPDGPFNSVAGEVQIPDNKTKPGLKGDYKKSPTYFNAFKSCPDCESTVTCVKNTALAIQKDPPKYCLAGYNCYSFVKEVLSKCGLTLTSTCQQLEEVK